MSIRIEKKWQLLTPENIAGIEAQLGVYQLADEDQRIIYIGYAGARSLFGLRSSLTEQLEVNDRKVNVNKSGGKKSNTRRQLFFRFEVNMQYMSRYEELLMLHVADFGELPELNGQPDNRLGKLTPD